MVELHYILAPLIGGIIGYITNDIAIRMLFRPHRAKYVFGFHVPFTPGIIPKEKGRIAQSIGGVISGNLMNREVLERYLLSEDMLQKVRGAVDGFLDGQRHNAETLREFLLHYVTADEVESVSKDVRGSIAGQIEAKLADPSIAENIARMAMDTVAERLSRTGANGLFGGVVGTIGSLLGGDVTGRFLDMVRKPTEEFLSRNIAEMLQKNGRTMADNMLGGEIGQLLDTPVSRLLEGRDSQLGQISSMAVNLYRKVITEHLPKVLETLDISRIVRERINGMDVAETEKLILLVMQKELRAIVWLGALLGFIMGSLNILVH